MRLRLTLPFLVFVKIGFAQGGNKDICGCYSVTVSEYDSITSFVMNRGNRVELVFHYPNGQLKYQRVYQGDKIDIIYYYPTGIKCKEEIQDYSKENEDIRWSRMWMHLPDSSTFVSGCKVKDIDTSLFRVFPHWADMSDCSGKFNATDVGRGPRRRLFFFARSGDHWIVSYEHGGIGYHPHCFFIACDSNGKYVVYETMQEVKSWDNLKSIISSGKLKIEKWDWYDH